MDRPADDNLTLQLDDLRKWGDRISEAIDAGMIMDVGSLCVVKHGSRLKNTIYVGNRQTVNGYH